MIVDDIRTLPAYLADRASLMALDLGSKTIGVAVSDDERRIASSLDTIRRTKFTQDAKTLLTVVTDYDIAGFVLGLPVNMDGTEGPRCQSVRQFGANFADKTDLPIAFWDERMSTQAVERHLIAQDVTRKRRASVIDKMAAQFILQGALDFLRNLAD
ncbi:MAG: Holliday junction resolvase RuvX [Pseudomonadota bacterium]|nr:Holliday junction resolvase RuvX [Pseudomonadota bacterium]